MVLSLMLCVAQDTVLVWSLKGSPKSMSLLPDIRSSATKHDQEFVQGFLVPNRE